MMNPKQPTPSVLIPFLKSIIVESDEALARAAEAGQLKSSTAMAVHGYRSAILLALKLAHDELSVAPAPFDAFDRGLN